MLNFWRVPAFTRVIFRISHRSRQRKLKQFYQTLHHTSDDRVLDIGVAPMNWSAVSGAVVVENFLEATYPWPERLTVVSIDPLPDFATQFPQIQPVQADGCRLPFADGSFDLVFSNAVIEHVGDRWRQAAFVRECLRVARRGVFIAAPNRWFPYDTHVALPLIHLLPRAFWKRFSPESGLHLLTPLDLIRLCPGWSRPKVLSTPWALSTVVIATPKTMISQERRIEAVVSRS